MNYSDAATAIFSLPSDRAITATAVGEAEEQMAKTARANTATEDSIVLWCILFCYLVFYCIVVYLCVFYCILVLFYSIVVYCSVFYCIVFFFVFYSTVLCCVVFALCSCFLFGHWFVMIGESSVTRTIALPRAVDP